MTEEGVLCSSIRAYFISKLNLTVYQSFLPFQYDEDRDVFDFMPCCFQEHLCESQYRSRPKWCATSRFFYYFNYQCRYQHGYCRYFRYIILIILFLSRRCYIDYFLQYLKSFAHTSQSIMSPWHLSGPPQNILKSTIPVHTSRLLTSDLRTSSVGWASSLMS